ncbi:hypothetical protein PUR29_32075 [Methylobacterium ajmalii]|uniref:Uncharacterized protein n=1 Tax=Methylobacterium ajmalii TaxID=2738439 RepID=A0ABV0A2Q3_9HYPH|nr:hypothetical protein [Methylobacterium aquaticum]
MRGLAGDTNAVAAGALDTGHDADWNAVTLKDRNLLNMGLDDGCDQTQERAPRQGLIGCEHRREGIALPDPGSVADRCDLRQRPCPREKIRAGHAGREPAALLVREGDDLDRALRY